jgi:hypothetical protein
VAFSIRHSTLIYSTFFAKLQIVHASDAFAGFALPIDNHLALMTDARALPALSTRHTCTKKALRAVAVDPQGASVARDTLFDSLCGRSHALNPKFHAMVSGRSVSAFLS